MYKWSDNFIFSSPTLAIDFFNASVENDYDVEHYDVRPERLKCVRSPAPSRNRPPDRYVVHNQTLNKVQDSLLNLYHWVHPRGTCLDWPSDLFHGIWSPGWWYFSANDGSNIILPRIWKWDINAWFNGSMVCRSRHFKWIINTSFYWNNLTTNLV